MNRGDVEFYFHYLTEKNPTQTVYMLYRARWRERDTRGGRTGETRTAKDRRKGKFLFRQNVRHCKIKGAQVFFWFFFG